MTIYTTDGPKEDEGTGAGIYSEELDSNLSRPLGVYTSVLQSEIIAICEHSQEMLCARVRRRRILI